MKQEEGKTCIGQHNEHIRTIFYCSGYIKNNELF